MRTSREEIESLIYLLEDPDPLVQNSVETRFRELGEQAVPILDQCLNVSKDRHEIDAISDILHRLTFENLYEEFAAQVQRPVNSRLRLEKSVFLVSRIGNPTLHIPDYRRRLDRMASDLYEQVRFEYCEEKRMRMLIHYLFLEMRFRGDQKQYHNPENGLMDRVIDRRRGLPISLSMIMMFLARRLDLPFYGVNMPIHFIVTYEGRDRRVLVDPFDGGTVISYDQCHYFLRKNGIRPKAEHLQRCSEEKILIRHIRNLIQSYTREEQTEKVKDLKRLLELVEPSDPDS